MHRTWFPTSSRIELRRSGLWMGLCGCLGLLLVTLPEAAYAVLPDKPENGSLRTLPPEPLLIAPPTPGGYSETPAGLSGKELASKTAELHESTAWESFVKEGGGWSVRWNLLTGTPHLAIGQPMAIAGTGKLTRDNIGPSCLAFIDTHADLMRINPDRLQLATATKAGGRWYVTFRQLYNGVPVLGGQVTLSFTKDDRLIHFGSDVFPDAAAEVNPLVDVEEAVRIARQHCNAAGPDQVGDRELTIVPLSNGTGFKYVLAWRLTIQQRSVHKKWRYLIDAGNGAIIGRWNLLVYADTTGTAQVEYKPEFANDATAIDVSSYENVRVNGPEIVIGSWDLDTNPGFTLTGQWAYGVPQGMGYYYQDPTAGFTGANVIGYNLAGDYPAITGTDYTTTPAIDCTGYPNVWLRFYRWLGVYDPYYDHASIQVSNNGSTWTTVWSNPTLILDTNWSLMEYDISSVAANSATVYVRWGMGPTSGYVPLPGWNIDDIQIVSYTGGMNSTQTGADGTYSVAAPNDPFCVNAKLAGAYCEIQYEGGGGNSVYNTCGWHPEDIVNWTWDSSVYHRIDEPSIYRHINFIHDYYKVLDPSFVGLDYPMPTTAYVPNYNNAYWDGTGVTFGGGDGVNCGDFGLYSEVIYHEYTHGVTDKMYTGVNFPYAMEPGAMNEGFSDYFGCALSLSQTGKVGDGGLIVGSPDGFRSLTNTYRRETDFTNEVHADSQMFSGSLWEARQVLGSSMMDEMVHFAPYAHPTTFEDYITALLIEDDTRYGDNNLANGTPHGQAIFDGFGHHGLGGLRYQAGSLAVSDATGNNNGRLDPSETVDLTVSLFNGWSDATGIAATLGTTDPYVTVVKSSASFPDAVLGATVVNAADPFRVMLSSDCPWTHTITFTLNITASGAYGYSRTCILRYPVAVGQLRIDDGEMDMYLGWGSQSAGRATAVRLTPDTYPGYLLQLRLYPYAYTSGAVTLQIWDDNGPNGSPGTVLGSLNATVNATGDWVDLDISVLGIAIQSGSFYVGWVEATNNAFYNGVDFDPPYQGRSWLYDGQTWHTPEYYGILTNLMIRVKTSAEPPVEINPPYQFTWSANLPVSGCLSANLGTPPYHWSAVLLPSGIDLSADGCFSGAHATIGTYYATVKATDSSIPPLSARKDFTFTFRTGSDLNRDGLVNHADVVTFRSCMNGSAMPPAAGCPAGVNADFDSDGDVDQSDFGTLQRCLVSGTPASACP